jgi:hypothetical protein
MLSRLLGSKTIATGVKKVTQDDLDWTEERTLESSTVTDFGISNKFKKTEKFDDVILEYTEDQNEEKIVISTRTECCERLEKEFLQIKHSLHPFSESDQKKYFLDFLREKNQLKDLTEAELGEIVEVFVESMKRSISAKNYKHTGVPLVTKLVAEYLECFASHTSKSTLNETLKIEKFNLWTLYENFITKSFIIYFTEKCGMDPKNPIKYIEMKKQETRILGNYKIYAIQEFLKKDAAKFFPNLANKKFSDFEIEEMAKVGLIYKTEDGYKFVHQTFAENFFTLHLMENFEQPKVAEFIVYSVFVEEKFQVIRSFVDFWIEEKMNQGNYDTYYRILLSEGSAEKTTPIHVSAKEQNSKIIEFIYNCLTKNSKFDSNKSKVEKYFFKCDDEKVPAICALITWSQNLNQILNSVRKNFGQKFVQKIKDQKEVFVELTKQEEVPNQIKEFLETKFKIKKSRKHCNLI